MLRTEKAINDIACHPLPPSFYEGGGLKHLRQRFDGISTSDSDNDSDYFSYPNSSNNSSKSSLSQEIRSELQGKGNSSVQKPSPFRSNTQRQNVHAGDLLSSTHRSGEGVRPTVRTRNSLYTPMPAPSSNKTFVDTHGAQKISGDDFDLRDEVMSCIAKSIGLLQPPLSGEESVEASPAFTPSEYSRPQSKLFGTSFGSLSLLEMGDDVSSSMTASSSSTNDGYLSGLDNEVEILFFPAGSVLARAGERNTGKLLIFEYGTFSSKRSSGLFYVIEGFLDILLPEPVGPGTSAPQPKSTQQSEIRASSMGSDSPAFEKHPVNRPAKERAPKDTSPKPLFTVKPGGIAGYLCTSRLPRRRFISHDVAPHSIVVQHCILRRHQGENGHLCGIPSITCP